jgi:hypothetical protein
MEVFSKYLIDKKYGYSGRNGQFPISHATMTESIGKIILITNDYPTQSILDELINGSSNKLDHFFNINVYKDSYITYDKVGISTYNNKNTLVNESKTNLQFYKTDVLNDNPEMVKNQEKYGMYNPSFQDCAQYGIQGTLMYLFIPDDNLNKWYWYFFWFYAIVLLLFIIMLFMYNTTFSITTKIFTILLFILYPFVMTTIYLWFIKKINEIYEFFHLTL